MFFQERSDSQDVIDIEDAHYQTIEKKTKQNNNNHQGKRTGPNSPAVDQ